MKIGIIIQTKEYEKAWNALRFAVASRSQGHEVKVFLVSDGVECVGLVHDTYNVDEQLKEFLLEGGEVQACKTCMNSRFRQGSESIKEATMVNCVELVTWADRAVTF